MPKKIGSIYPCSDHFQCCWSWCSSIFPSSIIMLLHEGFPFIFFVVHLNFVSDKLNKQHVSCSACRCAGNEFFQLLYVWKNYISPLCLKDIFTRLRILGWQFFFSSLCDLKMSQLSFSLYFFPKETSVVTVIFAPLYIMFSPTLVFKIFFISGFKQFSYNVTSCRISSFFLCSGLSSVDLWVYGFHQI